MRRGRPRAASSCLLDLWGGELVLDDLRNGTHGALLDAVAAGDARLLVHGLRNAVDDLQHLLGARVNADAAADALVSFNNWMWHELLLSGKFSSHQGPRAAPSITFSEKIPCFACVAYGNRVFLDNGFATQRAGQSRPLTTPPSRLIAQGPGVSTLHSSELGRPRKGDAPGVRRRMRPCPLRGWRGHGMRAERDMIASRKGTAHAERLEAEGAPHLAAPASQDGRKRADRYRIEAIGGAFGLPRGAAYRLGATNSIPRSARCNDLPVFRHLAP